MTRISRSPKMILAAYFMAKFGEPRDHGHLQPPAEMGVASWTEAYECLFPHLGGGREFGAFRSSIDKDRQHHLDCLSGAKTNSEARRKILERWVPISRAELWDQVRWLMHGSSPAAPFSSPAAPFSIPDEVTASAQLVEGATCQILVNAYERDPEARRQCIAVHGCTCCVCGFSFGSRYGHVAEGYIHVHHLRPLSEVAEVHLVDPVEDLRPVCPNCHAVLHRRVPAYSIEEVRAFLR